MQCLYLNRANTSTSENCNALQTNVLRVICIILFDVILTSAATTECFDCSNVRTVAECTNTKTCNTGEICYANFLPQINGTVYSFGCQPEANCTTVVSSTGNVTNGGAGTLIGRALPTSSCSQCCKEHHCNRRLCQQTYTDHECSDKPNVGCFTLEQYANICADTQRALSVCRRTCGLCSYVDGQWSTWLEWSRCDVSCGDGQQTRSRLCTEPAPAGGGKYCQGNSDDSQRCSLQPCPVHGHWSIWSNWGSCSTTCGIGMQRRDRTCSNPYPARFGDHCFGDSRDDKLCVAAVCPVTNGGWSSWTAWTTCTASCGGGIKSRYRDCNNPIPSAGGKPCTGPPYEAILCNQNACPRQFPSFQYSNPVSVGPEYKFGQYKGSIQCLRWAFFGSHGCSTIAFNTEIFQEGTYYKSATGEFTCYDPGVYAFTASLVSSSYINCVISKNDHAITSIQYKEYFNHTISQSGTTMLHLQQGDKVSLFCQHFASYLDSSSTFGGVLVHPDS